MLPQSLVVLKDRQLLLDLRVCELKSETWSVVIVRRSRAPERPYMGALDPEQEAAKRYHPDCG
jgi:hypothetical protein